jgi:hypothetical protein
VSELPIIRQAQRDLALGRLALAVFDVLRDHLDLREFRAVKLDTLEAAVDRSRPQVVGALRELVTHGYLDRGDRAWARGPWTYRLCYSKGGPPPAATPPSVRGVRYGMVSKGEDW